MQGAVDSLDRQKCTFCTFLTRRLLQCVQARRALVWVNVFSIRLIGGKKRFCLFVFYFVCLKRELFLSDTVQHNLKNFIKN